MGRLHAPEGTGLPIQLGVSNARCAPGDGRYRRSPCRYPCKLRRLADTPRGGRGPARRAGPPAPWRPTLRLCCRNSRRPRQRASPRPGLAHRQPPSAPAAGRPCLAVGGLLTGASGLVPLDLRRLWEWRYLKRTSAGGIFTLQGQIGKVTNVAFSPDGGRLALSVI